MKETYLLLDDVFTRLQNDHRPLVLYGMGNGAEKMLALLKKIGKTPVAVFASNDFVRGQSFCGYTVKRLSDIEEEIDDFVIILSFGTRKEDVIETIASMAKKHTLIMPDAPVAGEDIFDKSYLLSHMEEVKAAFDMFADATSKTIYENVICYKISGDISYLEKAYSQLEDVDKLLDFPIYYALDGGAYDGDTARELLAKHPEIARIFSVEPDRKNHARLVKNIEKYGLSETVFPIYGALAERNGSGMLSVSGNRNASLFSASYGADSEEVPLLTVDEIVKDVSLDFIKYDVEGAEKEALAGSIQTIKRCRPALAVSVYHRSHDIFALPLLVAKLCSNYAFYLRRPRCLPAWETTLYAIPLERSKENG